MKKLLLYCFVLLSLKGISQSDPYITKMDVPPIALGEKQNFQVLSYEAVRPDKYSVLYMQELPASIVGDKEFKGDKTEGAYANKELSLFVPNSNKVIFLIRQTFNKSGESNTNFWVVAVRELVSESKYVMTYPANFVHPMIKDGIEVTYTMHNVELIKGLTPHEFEALVAMGKKMYGFYTYPKPTATYKEPDLIENLKLLKSGFKEMKAALGKGDIPKNEKVLFKRDIVENMKMAGTYLNKKDSVQINLYISSNNDGHYDLLKSQTYPGSVMPGFSTSLVYDQSLKVAGAFGYVQLKYKDAGGSKANLLALGIDNNGDPEFWTIDAGKNTLNSFLPWLSYTDGNDIYVVSRNQEKIFKPYYQHHLLKNDGSVVTLYPTNEGEVNSEKKVFLYTEQEKKPVSSSTTSSVDLAKEDVPVGIYTVGKSRYLITAPKSTHNNGPVSVTGYGDLSVMLIGGDNKIKEFNDIQENQSAEQVYPIELGHYADMAYFLVNYPNKFMLKLSETKMETETIENATYKLVYGADNNCISYNQYGEMMLTKPVVGNKYSMLFFPAN